jgi:tRNA dimethylallyltransferase
MTLRVQPGSPAMPPAIFLMGPTAAGKTGLAVELHQRFPLDVISVDSAMVYRGMDIGTAKPDAATLARAPHRLIDIREPFEPYSAAEFREDALREMAAITSAGRIPLLVGGTMLYFRALSQGLAQLPKASPEVRKRLEAQAQIMGWAGLHQQLAQLDPAAAERIHPNDPQRIQRALEVIEVSGRKMSELQSEHRLLEEEQCGYRILRLIVCPSERLTLHRNIEKRFQNMLEQGFIDEVRELRGRGDLTAELPAMRCVGYRQVWNYLEDELDQQLMIRKAVAATRQLAKRQLTWLRQQPAALWYDLALDSAHKSVFRDVAKFIES